MDVKYQVFVSSTFVDLKEERRTVIEMILNMGHIPVGMEAFQASDDTQWDYIKRRIDESDYYVLIVAERYGSEQNGKSYTQMEYEYAVKTGVPVVSFLLDSNVRKDWPSSKVEHEKKEKVEKLRKLCERKLVKFWKNSDDLGGKVALALNELIRDKPRTGWVRADSVPSAGVLSEIAKLSEEKRQLQQQVEKMSSQNSISPETLIRLKELSALQVLPFIGYDADADHPYSLLQAFLDLFNTMLSPADGPQINEKLRDVFEASITDQDAEDLAYGFVKYDLVTARGVRNSSAWVTFEVTSYGKTFLLHATRWLAEKSSEAALSDVTDP
jgi:hypothetical protein